MWHSAYAIGRRWCECHGKQVCHLTPVIQLPLALQKHILFPDENHRAAVDGVGGGGGRVGTASGTAAHYGILYLRCSEWISVAV